LLTHVADSVSSNEDQKRFKGHSMVRCGMDIYRHFIGQDRDGETNATFSAPRSVLRPITFGFRFCSQISQIKPDVSRCAIKRTVRLSRIPVGIPSSLAEWLEWRHSARSHLAEAMWTTHSGDQTTWPCVNTACFVARDVIPDAVEFPPRVLLIIPYHPSQPCLSSRPSQAEAVLGPFRW